MRTGSVRLRVSVAAMALLIIAVLVLDTAVLWAFKTQNDRELRSRLANRAAVTRTMLVDTPPEEVIDRVSGDGINATLRAPRDGHGRSGRPPAQPPMSTPVPADVARREAVRRRPQGGYVAVIHTGNNQRIELLASDTPNKRAFASLLTILLLFSAALVALSALVVRWVVGAALGPLDSVVTTAGRIAQGDTKLRLRPQRNNTDLGRLAASFDHMVDELEGAATRERQHAEQMRVFLGDASHELRTPLAGVQASAETLLRDDPPRDDRETLTVGIIRETGRLARLVDDLLRVTRLDAGSELPTRRQPVDVVAVAHTEADRTRDLQVHVVVEGDPQPVSGDADGLGRILRNLLDNAALAAPGGQATLTIAPAPSGSPKGVAVTVDDNGPGVPPEARERIFERFARLDKARSRDAGGSGLGLAISRSLAAAHGGTLVCVDPPDQQPGARFVLTLPAVDPGRFPAPTGTPVQADVTPASGSDPHQPE